MDIYQRVPQRRLVDSVKPMCTYDKVLNQRVDWIEWADIQLYGARDAIYDACATSSGGRPGMKHHVAFARAPLALTANM